PDGSVVNPLQPSQALLKVAKDVGAITDFLIIASNTPHLFQKEIENVSGRKVVSIVDATIAEVERRGYAKVGVMAVGEALKRGLYQHPLDHLGIAWEAIPKSISEDLDKTIFALMEGGDIKTLRKTTQDVVTYLRAQHVDGIILGCTEFPLLLGKEGERQDIINPSQLLAEAAVRYAIGG
ncbi:MAG: amino acid racemase, partial [Candidatus Sungiibacteriota bacterium]